MKIKDPQQNTKFIIKAAQRLGTNSEFGVLTIWLLDSPSFVASALILAERTGLTKRRVNEILKSLVTKEILNDTGHISKYGVKIYEPNMKILTSHSIPPKPPKKKKPVIKTLTPTYNNVVAIKQTKESTMSDFENLDVSIDKLNNEEGRATESLEDKVKADSQKQAEIDSHMGESINTFGSTYWGISARGNEAKEQRASIILSIFEELSSMKCSRNQAKVYKNDMIDSVVRSIPLWVSNHIAKKNNISNKEAEEKLAIEVSGSVVIGFIEIFSDSDIKYKSLQRFNHAQSTCHLPSGGMGHHEYTLQRKHAESFPVLSEAKRLEARKSRNEATMTDDEIQELMKQAMGE